MKVLTSILGACFVGGIAYVLAVYFFLFGFSGLSENKATGVNALSAVARSPEALLVGFGAFVLSFWFFVKRRRKQEA